MQGKIAAIMKAYNKTKFSFFLEKSKKYFTQNLLQRSTGVPLFHTNAKILTKSTSWKEESEEAVLEPPTNAYI